MRTLRHESVGAMTALPTRRDETWRYSDLEAVARVWPVATRRHVVAPGETLLHDIVIDAADDEVAIEDHEVEIGAGARAEFRVAIVGGKLGRIFVKVRLASKASFDLTGAIVGGGSETHEIVTRVLHAEPDATSAQTVRAILDETDSGLDIDALRSVGAGINTIMRKPDRAVLLITHYQRLLDYVRPDFVHVLADGRIVRSGGPELALQLEAEGYADIAA